MGRTCGSVETLLSSVIGFKGSMWSWRFLYCQEMSVDLQETPISPRKISKRWGSTPRAIQLVHCLCCGRWLRLRRTSQPLVHQRLADVLLFPPGVNKTIQACFHLCATSAYSSDTLTHLNRLRPVYHCRRFLIKQSKSKTTCWKRILVKRKVVWMFERIFHIFIYYFNNKSLFGINYEYFVALYEHAESCFKPCGRELLWLIGLSFSPLNFEQRAAALFLSSS